MIKTLSLASISFFSAIYCNLAEATSCSNIDADGFEYKTEYPDVFSACLEAYQQDDIDNTFSISEYSGHHSGDDGGYHTGHSTHDDSNSYQHDDSGHDKSGDDFGHHINWHDYDLDRHDHDNSDHHSHSDYDDFDKHDGHKHEHENHHEYEYHPPKGDVGGTVVPVPAAIWLFISGLIGLLFTSRNKFK